MSETITTQHAKIRKPMSEEHKRKIGLANSISLKGNVPWNKGKPYPQITAERNNFWKGGRIYDKRGYIAIYQPNHPFARRKFRYVFEHRLIVEKQLGRYLKKKEIVHHINENPSDNRIQNLMVFKNGRYHFWFHKKGSCNPIGIIFDGRYVA